LKKKKFWIVNTSKKYSYGNSDYSNTIEEVYQ
jgi:hypothetical protein